MSDPRPDTGPPSIADAIYGPSGPISDGQGLGRSREVIESGIARPAGEAGRPAPLFGGDQPRQPAPSPAAPAGEVFDPGRVALPDGYEAGDMMGEFANLAREFGLNQKQGERAIDFYRRSVEASEEAYSRELDAEVDRLAAELNPTHVAAARDMINDPNLTPIELKSWVLKWSHHPHFARMLTAWAAAARGGRRW